MCIRDRIHSMAMEFLTAPWHHLLFGKDTEKYALLHAEDSRWCHGAVRNSMAMEWISALSMAGHSRSAGTLGSRSAT